MDLSIYSSYMYYLKCLKFFAIFSFISHSLVVNILASPLIAPLILQV